jgi:hypothetical protein
MKVIQLLGSGGIDHKTAALMLYGLQTASANLRNAKFEPEKPTDVVIDEDTVDLTRINGMQWSARDFKEKERPGVTRRTTRKTGPAGRSNGNRGLHNAAGRFSRSRAQTRTKTQTSRACRRARAIVAGEDSIGPHRSRLGGARSGAGQRGYRNAIFTARELAA